MEANRYWDSEYLELYIGFQMPQAKFSRIADSVSKNILLNIDWEKET